MPDIESVEPTTKNKLSLDEIISKITPSIVTIIATKDLPVYKKNFNPVFEDGVEKGMPREVGAGSGFIIENNLILTNNHVVDIDGADYTAVLNNGTEYETVVINRDSINDVAVLKIKSSINNLPAINLGDSDKLSPGQNVFTNDKFGVIKSLNSDIIASAKSLNNLIQTNIPIKSGDSGSPLVNLYGEVIGINVALAEGSLDIGFAVPIDDVKAVLGEIK